MASPTDPDTSQLIRMARDGDPTASDQLLQRHRPRLRRMIGMHIDRRIAARVDPSDVVQEAMADASQRLEAYLKDPPRAFYPWLRQIAWDRLIDMYRMHIGADRRSVLREQTAHPDLNDDSIHELANQLASSSANPTRRIMRAEMFARVREALKQLSPQDRELLVLRHLEQLGVREIADVLGVSDTVVTTRHLRALQRLRKLLGDEFGESS